MVIYLDLLLPIGSCDLPLERQRAIAFYAPFWSCSRWGLQSHLVA